MTSIHVSLPTWFIATDYKYWFVVNVRVVNVLCLFILRSVTDLGYNVGYATWFMFN